MKKIIITTIMILMIPAMCLANYRITYVEYYTPDKPGPLHQRIKVIEVKEVISILGGVVLYRTKNGKKGSIKSPFIDIKEIDPEKFPETESAKFTAII